MHLISENDGTMIAVYSPYEVFEIRQIGETGWNQIIHVKAGKRLMPRC